MRVLSVRRLPVKETPVCDVTVAGLENFCLASGVAVHNSKDIADSLAGCYFTLANRREIWVLHNILVMDIPTEFRETKDKMKKDDAAYDEAREKAYEKVRGEAREYNQPMGGDSYTEDERAEWAGLN